MDQDPNATKIREWLYSETEGRMPVDLKVSGCDGQQPPYVHSMEYALRLMDAPIAPADPHPATERGKSYYAPAWLNFDHLSVTNGIMPHRGMFFTAASPIHGVTPFVVPMPVFTFAYDASTLVARYDPEIVNNLEVEALGDVLYLTLEQCIDPDNYWDHHDLERDRSDAQDLAMTVAASIVSANTNEGFAYLLSQHVEDFHTEMPWPEQPVTTHAKNGLITITVTPRDEGQ